MQVIDAESFFAVSSVSRETMERLRVYEALVLKWQKSINLVSASTLPDIWARHMWDSAQLAGLAPENATFWLDVGSGAGFPGLVVAAMLRNRPDFRMHLVESDQRKGIFLREAARVMELPVTVHTARIENWALQGDRKPDIISARALASLGQLLTWTSAFWGKETIGLFLKGQTARDELTQAQKDWIFEAEAIASRSDGSGQVLKLWGLKHADHRYET
ncbi:MAG: 16S rRNA (guanine(527)-N(7))-methyltransferase RsmG [Parvibaculum sp.]|nr:16S rRNA (guanine(527)-N(7))-methyltransferase RsmG [Parvibaculum sp.]